MTTDGRRKRSQTSREKIVVAMLDLVSQGHISPSAEQVATRAEVGLRSVFRHFTDMESLYAEMAARLSQHYAQWLVPYDSADWRGQLAETIARRTGTYEHLMPFKQAADAHRHESAALQAEHARTLAAMRARLHSLLPERIAADEGMFEALDLLLSFEIWQRLRIVQGVPVDAARDLVIRQVDRALGG